MSEPHQTLTTKEEAFANMLIDGVSQAEAYQKVYESVGNNTTLRRAGYEISRRPHVAAYIAERRKELRDNMQMSRERMLTILAGIAEDDDATRGDRIKAIAQASKMCGFDAPVKTEGTTEVVVKWQV